MLKKCKICGNSSLSLFAHTAHCDECGVMLYYPYPEDDCSLVANQKGKKWPRERVLNWYSKSSFKNHSNFTQIVKFTIDESCIGKQIDVLDFGGGGGQFALIVKSLFPESTPYITDISDEALLKEWRPLNRQIPFANFYNDNQKFDFIFLNDVFEHVSDPLYVLSQLSKKLKKDGRIFIDTPKQFWIYPITRIFSKSIYEKVLRGTVSKAHLQIWSKKSFELIVKKAKLKICKYKEISEYTMPPEYYLNNMGIKNPILGLVGRIFYGNSNWLARNKIISVLSLDKNPI